MFTPVIMCLISVVVVRGGGGGAVFMGGGFSGFLRVVSLSGVTLVN